jgi:hypothetical protein
MKMDTQPGREITTEEDWQITCHEAGHATLAVRYCISFVEVKRGDGEFGELEASGCPLDHPGRSWPQDVISRWQHFYAAGAAAEQLMFGSFRPYAASRDLFLHGRLEELRPECRQNAWNQDIKAALKVLDRDSVEKVAKALACDRKLSDEQVYALFDRKPPWW